MVDISDFNYIDKDYSEAELIRNLIVDSNNTINYHIIKVLFENPFEANVLKSYEGYYVYQNILRSELGFNKNIKPGDFDLIIIPFNNEKIYFERTASFEVKVVRPTRLKPKKNSNSLGISQVWGLINDGFPLVGLIHFCLPEALHENEKIATKYIGEISSNELLTESEMVKIPIDFFSNWAATNQIKRLISTDLPKYVGLCCLGINTTQKNRLRLGINLNEHTRFENGYFNPKKSSLTIEKIKLFHFNNKNKAIIADSHYK